MKHDGELPHSETDSLQMAFDDQAAGLGLELEAPNMYGRDIGAFVRGVAAVAFVGTPKSPEVPGKLDDELLASVIQEWEQLDPDAMGRRWKEFATDPFIAVGHGAISYMNDAGYRIWRYDEEARRELEQFPPSSPRDIKIHDLAIRYVGRTTAVVTYSVEERYTNGKIRVTNAGVMALKTAESAWKVAAETIPEKEIP